MAIPFKRLRNWTDPASVAAPEFAHISYALFCLDRREDGTGGAHAGRIIAARSPDRNLWQPGQPLPDLEDLSPMARRYLTGALTAEDLDPTGISASAETGEAAFAEPGFLFVWTRTGLGILTRRYAPTADLGLLLHLHVDPLSGARLLTGGAFGGAHMGGGFALSPLIRAVTAPPTERDMPSYTYMNDARLMLESMTRGFMPPGCMIPTDRSGAMPLSAVFTISAFAGCDVSLELDGHPVARPNLGAADAFGRLSIPEPERDYIVCRDPIVPELILLVLFSEVRDYSRRRGAICRITTGRRWSPSSITIEYDPVADLSTNQIEALLELRTHLSRVATFHGMALSAAPIRLHPIAAALAAQILTVEWLETPAALPTGDLKAYLYLRDDSDLPT